jgi:FkbM family methyltransferase
MKRVIKDFIRSRPGIYDILKAVKRRLGGAPDPQYDWFDSFSRSQQDTVRFIQIGASDGLRNDPVREFIVRDHWQGVLIEPLPEVFEMLKRNYAGRSGLSFLNAAISQEEGSSLSFWTFKPEFLRGLSTEKRMDYLRKASFDKAHVRKFLNAEPEDVLREIPVPCRTLTSVMNQYLPGGLDLLVIDAEGHEPHIIRSIDFAAVRPKAVFFESHHIAAEMPALTQLFAGAGYRMEHIGGDSVAIR